MRHNVTAFENTTHPFRGYQPDDHLILVGSFAVEADTVGDATEEAFAIGNRQRADANGTQWPVRFRSMSVGDVVVVDGLPFSVDGMGFSMITHRAVFGAIRGTRPDRYPTVLRDDAGHPTDVG